MLDTALPKLEQLIDKLIVKNDALLQEKSTLAEQNETLAQQIKQLEDDNESKCFLQTPLTSVLREHNDDLRFPAPALLSRFRI